MKFLTVFSAILDIFIVAVFLLMPRTGMEAMGTSFLLIPLTAIRVVVAAIGFFMAYRRRQWGFIAYTLVMLSIVAGLWKFGWSLKPTDKPLYRALSRHARQQALNLSDYKDRKTYDVRRLIQKAGDADHARLCDLLAEERDLAGLKDQLALKPDLSKTCVAFDGDRVGPVMHAVIHSYGPWPEGPMKPLFEQLLNAGAEINHQNRHGQTPLIMTAYGSTGREPVASVLLASGADPNLQDYRGDTLLHLLAAKNGRGDSSGLVRLLLSNGAGLEIRNRKHLTPLMAAVARKNAAVLKLLIEAGANVNVRNNRGTPMINSLISCDPGKLSMLTLLVTAGVDVAATTEYGPLPLAQAFYNHLYLDCLDPAIILLNAGADPNRQDRNGTAAIHSLGHWSKKNPAPALALLLDHGARIDIRNQQAMTALLLAARYGESIAPLQALLERRADPNAVDENGNTLLHCVAMNAKPGGKKHLAFALAAGGDPAAVNHKGQTALDRARLMRNQPMIDALAVLNP